jgi:Class II flagellar assembly regulator
MKISQTGSGAPANRSRKTGRAAGAGAADAFKSHILDDTASSASGASTSPPLTALSNLLAIQETPDPTSERRRALLQGDTLLDELTELQVGLVQGWVSEDTLRRVSHLLNRPRPDLDDKALSQVLDEIEVRAAVELAKLERTVEPEP